MRSLTLSKSMGFFFIAGDVVRKEFFRPSGTRMNKGGGFIFYKKSSRNDVEEMIEDDCTSDASNSVNFRQDKISPRRLGY